MKALKTAVVAAGLALLPTGAALAHGYYNYPAGRGVVRPYVPYARPYAAYPPGAYWGGGPGFYGPGFGMGFGFYGPGVGVGAAPFSPYVAQPYGYYGPYGNHPYAPYSYGNRW